jgi:hypothetical protein
MPEPTPNADSVRTEKEWRLREQIAKVLDWEKEHPGTTDAEWVLRAIREADWALVPQDVLTDTPNAEFVRHEAAWRIPTEDGTDYGVLVRCGPPGRPYWWLLCPGTATLYLDESHGFDLRDCNHGLECDFLDDVHAAAHAFVAAPHDRSDDA